ncbi:MAG: glycosyltransferase, partial [Ruminococcus sp.]|nr:glycosyltransferase [Ruminococcus sp.]
MVSVIIPVYNVRPFLCESLNSVINQTYKNIEIIIVDDGSTDGSGEICDEYQQKDERIIVIHQENKGLSAARNSGLDAMHGDIVAFLDSDDAFLPEFIQIMVSSMLKTSVDIVMCGYYSCHTENRMTVSCSYNQNTPRHRIYSPNQVLNKMMKDEMNMFVWNKVYSSKLFSSLRFPSGYVYEDMLLLPLIIEKAKRILTINTALVFYRKRIDSISATFSEKSLRDWFYAIKEREKFVANRTPSVFSEYLRE